MSDNRYCIIRTLNDYTILSISEAFDFDGFINAMCENYYDGRKKLDRVTIENIKNRLDRDGIFYFENIYKYCGVDVEFKIESSPLMQKSKTDVRERIFSQIKPFLRNEKINELGI